MNKRVCVCVCNVYGVPYVGMYSVYLYTKLTVCIWSFNVYKKYKKYIVNINELNNSHVFLLQMLRLLLHVLIISHSYYNRNVRQRQCILSSFHGSSLSSLFRSCSKRLISRFDRLL